MCDKLENRGDLIFGILVKKLKYIDVFFILGIVYHHWKRRGGRRERKREEGGGRWALDCAAHQIKQILCKDSVVFWGVNFCGEGFWEKHGGFLSSQWLCLSGYAE